MTARPRFTCPRCGRTVAARGTRPEHGPSGATWPLRYHRRPDGDVCIASNASHLIPADTPPAEATT